MGKVEVIKPSVSMIDSSNLTILEAVEAAGRTCYKSEDKITEGSAEKFVRMLCERGHTAMLEHATIYFTWPQGIASSPQSDILYSRFSHVEYDDDYAYVTTNLRVVFEACEKDYERTMRFIEQYAVESTEKHEKRHSFRIICDRGVTHELVRHRVFSFAQESTRYVRYGDKQPFRVIEPSWWEAAYETQVLAAEKELFISCCEHCAEVYEHLLNLGQTAQQARAVLPNATKTEIVMTGTTSQWEAFLALRTASSAHPDMQIIANMIKEELVNEIAD